MSASARSPGRLLRLCCVDVRHWTGLLWGTVAARRRRHRLRLGRQSARWPASACAVSGALCAAAVCAWNLHTACSSSSSTSSSWSASALSWLPLTCAPSSILFCARLPPFFLFFFFFDLDGDPTSTSSASHITHHGDHAPPTRRVAQVRKSGNCELTYHSDVQGLMLPAQTLQAKRFIPWGKCKATKRMNTQGLLQSNQRIDGGQGSFSGKLTWRVVSPWNVWVRGLHTRVTSHGTSHLFRP